MNTGVEKGMFPRSQDSGVRPMFSVLCCVYLPGPAMLRSKSRYYQSRILSSPALNLTPLHCYLISEECLHQVCLCRLQLTGGERRAGRVGKVSC